jgi:hypothetical protein
MYPRISRPENLCDQSKEIDIAVVEFNTADPGGCAVQGVCLRPLACWDCGFEFRRDIPVCLLSMSCFVQVRKITAKGRSLVQRILTECVCVTDFDELQQYPTTCINIKQKT